MSNATSTAGPRISTKVGQVGAINTRQYCWAKNSKKENMRKGSLLIQPSFKSLAAQSFLGWTAPPQPMSNLPPIRPVA
jgi:hypothetical protein